MNKEWREIFEAFKKTFVILCFLFAMVILFGCVGKLIVPIIFM